MNNRKDVVIPSFSVVYCYSEFTLGQLGGTPIFKLMDMGPTPYLVSYGRPMCGSVQDQDTKELTTWYLYATSIPRSSVSFSLVTSDHCRRTPAVSPTSVCVLNSVDQDVEVDHPIIVLLSHSLGYL